jgi:hypothetical protein
VSDIHVQVTRRAIDCVHRTQVMPAKNRRILLVGKFQNLFNCIASSVWFKVR